jgi:hypothetical protein
LGSYQWTIIDDFWEPQNLVPTIRHRILSYAWLCQWHSHMAVVQRSPSELNFRSTHPCITTCWL